MKKLICLSFIALATQVALAQFTVAPFGSAGAGAPPVGESRVSKCGAQGCLEVKVQPYCFGTNLRAYNTDNQLRPNENVTMNIEFADAADSSKKDIFKVVFPAGVTFPSDGIKTECSVIDPNASGAIRNIKCLVPSAGGEINYKITNWKVAKNPSCFANGGSHGQEYCDYAAVQTDAVIQSSSAADSNIKCLYKFSPQYKIIPNSVKCVFPSQSPDYSSIVKVYDSANNDISSSVSMKSFVNNINFVFSQSMASRSKPQMVKHGEPVTAPAPSHKISYMQGTRNITSVIESEKFDEANANNSFTSIVKFPGQEGFCGGFYSPLMLFFDDKLPQFNGVSLFPLYGSKEGSRVNWPEKDAPGYFLAKLEKVSDEISSHTQLFGKDAKFQNGFEALAAHDSNKDGVIDSRDPIFKSLFLWRDTNSNGHSEEGEIVSLKSKGVQSIDLKYSTRDVTKFDSRARAREKSKFLFKNKKGKIVKSNIFDVWLSPID